MKLLKPMPELTVEELLSHDPEAAAVFVRLRMAGVGCVMARFETLAETAAADNMEVKMLLEQLQNRLMSNRAMEPASMMGRTAELVRMGLMACLTVLYPLANDSVPPAHQADQVGHFPFSPPEYGPLRVSSYSGTGAISPIACRTACFFILLDMPFTLSYSPLH